MEGEPGTPGAQIAYYRVPRLSWEVSTQDWASHVNVSTHENLTITFRNRPWHRAYQNRFVRDTRAKLCKSRKREYHIIALLKFAWALQQETTLIHLTSLGRDKKKICRFGEIDFVVRGAHCWTACTFLILCYINITVVHESSNPPAHLTRTLTSLMEDKPLRSELRSDSHTP